MAVTKSRTERLADIKKHRAEMAKKRAAHKKAKAEKKAAKKPVSVEKTKGGDYPVYKKGSAKAESFSKSFGRASKAGKKTFKWKGRSYTTEKAPAKKVSRGDAETAQKITDTAAPPKETKAPAPKTQYEKMAERKKLKPSFAKGGKVDGDAGYNWPTRDARSGFGKKK